MTNLSSLYKKWQIREIYHQKLVFFSKRLVKVATSFSSYKSRYKLFRIASYASPPRLMKFSRSGLVTI